MPPSTRYAVEERQAVASRRRPPGFPSGSSVQAVPSAVLSVYGSAKVSVKGR